MTKGKKEDLEKKEVMFDCFVFFCIYIYISCRSVMTAFILILQPYRRPLQFFSGKKSRQITKEIFAVSGTLGLIIILILSAFFLTK